MASQAQSELQPLWSGLKAAVTSADCCNRPADLKGIKRTKGKFGSVFLSKFDFDRAENVFNIWSEVQPHLPIVCSQLCSQRLFCRYPDAPAAFHSTGIKHLPAMFMLRTAFCCIPVERVQIRRGVQGHAGGVGGSLTCSLQLLVHDVRSNRLHC